jgi:hypothetical protein
MIKRFLISLLILISLTHLCFSQGASYDENLRHVISRKGQAEVIIANPGTRSIDRLSREVSIRSVNSKSVKIILSPLTVEWFLSERYDYQVIEQSDNKGVTPSKNISEAMEWESYPSYTQYDSIMKFFASSYPSLCRLDTIGTTIKGRLVLALKISDNCNVDESEPEVFYTSSMHGDETAGYILMLRLADYLLRSYNSDTRTKTLTDNLEIWINPLANPDGTYRDGNFIISPVRNNANGDDLNRNFPDPHLLNNVPQKETLDMMSFMASRRFALSANFHSGEEVVNYPWDSWSVPHADEGWFYDVSRAWADTVHLYSRQGYMDFLDNGVTNGYDWYVVYGGRQDYVTYTLNGREITVELDTNYVTPSTDLDELWEYNRRSLLGYLENALYGIHGKVTDLLSKKPVKAMIFIEGHDKDNSQVYSDSLDGFFTRLLEPGYYNLKVTASGYRDTVISNVNVISGEKAILLINIHPEINPPDTTNPAHPLFYPNPGNTFINAVLPESIRGPLKIRIYSLAGTKVSDYETEASDIYPVLIDVSWLPAGMYYIVFTSSDTSQSCRGSILVIR